MKSTMSASRPSRILQGKVNFPLTLAPMVGLTHVALRLVMRQYLPEGAVTLWPTEMLNSRKLPFEDLSKTPEAMRHESETELVPQILGNEETAIAASVEKLILWGAEAIDINMGCPVQKALKHNYGVALMGDAAYAQEVVRITVKNSSVPVSVKLRAGNQGDFTYLKNFVDGLCQAGASWITLHPRTAEQKRRGQADWQQIRELKKLISIPLIGNGDVQTMDDVIQMKEQTACDMVMAGRALAARPWMLWQLGEKLGFANPPGKTGAPPRSMEEEGAEYGKVLLQLLPLMKKYFGEELAQRKFRFYVKTTSVWLPFGHSLYANVTKGKNTQEIETAVADFFSRTVEMTAKTELRQ
jgi:tRNA-dihydrouridine synthase B